MELTFVATIVLAAAVFVLSGMIAYVYWQQTRMMNQVQSLAQVIAKYYIPDHTPPEPEPEVQPEPEPEAKPQPEPEVKEEAPVDDRVEVVDKPADEPDIDDLQTKSVVQLKELLSKKGIPFGKRESKTGLLQLLKATA